MEISYNVSDYEVVEDIGKGQFGVVQKIRLKTASDAFLVWKRIPYAQMHEKEKRQLTEEVQLLQALRHPNVVRYLGKINEKSKAILYLLMEFCDGGDLGRYLDHTVRKGHHLPEDMILSWFRQLVDALHYCHTRENGRVLHRDLKPQNILLSGRYKKLKLADFGLAKMMQPSQLMAQTHVGTPYYMSPTTLLDNFRPPPPPPLQEVLGRRHYDEKSDIWSLGSPFSRAQNYDDLCQLVRSGSLDTGAVPGDYSPEILRCATWMLSLDPSLRPTTDELRRSTLYRWSAALRYKDVSERLRCAVEQQKNLLVLKTRELDEVRRHVQRISGDLRYLEEYIQFIRESDEAIRRSFRLVGAMLKLPDAPQHDEPHGREGHNNRPTVDSGASAASRPLNGQGQ